MTKLRIVHYIPEVHKDQFYELNLEYFEWADKELATRYNDPLNPSGTVKEFLDENFPEYISIKPPNGVILVVEGNKELVGMGVIKRLEGDTGEISQVYIKPNSRGGYGKKLVYMLVKEARKLDFSKIQLNTAKFMEIAQHIYESVGFKKTEYHYGDTENPEEVTAIRMEMSLSE